MSGYPIRDEKARPRGEVLDWPLFSVATSPMRKPRQPDPMDDRPADGRHRSSRLQRPMLLDSDATNALDCRTAGAAGNYDASEGRSGHSGRRSKSICYYRLLCHFMAVKSEKAFQGAALCSVCHEENKSQIQLQSLQRS